MKTKTPTTTALAMPALHPKPTKTEIVEAMLARAAVKHDAENERRSKIRDSIQKKINALAIKAAKTMTPSVNIYAYGKIESSHCDVRFSNVKSPELDKLFDQYRAVAILGWNEKEMRDAIKRELSGIQNPNPTRLLDNPATVKAIDALLKQWGM